MCKTASVDTNRLVKLIVIKVIISLTRKMRNIPKIKKFFDPEYDLLFDGGFRYDISKNCGTSHIGQSKWRGALCGSYSRLYGQAAFRLYRRFMSLYAKFNRSEGKNQFLVPYLMSSHPGSTLSDAVELAEFLHREGVRPEQVQDFYPTPGTISTCMYFTGIDPFTNRSVYVARTPHEKELQRALLQYFLPENRDLVAEALRKRIAWI